MPEIEDFHDLPLELMLAAGPASASVCYVTSLVTRPDIKPDGEELCKLFHVNFSGTDAWKRAYREYVDILEITEDKDAALQAYCGMVGMFAAMIVRMHAEHERSGNN